MREFTFGWTVHGELRLEDTTADMPFITIIFHDPSAREVTRLEKLEFLHNMLLVALNTPILTEEPNENQPPN